MKLFLKFFLLISITFSWSSCGIYSFTGASTTAKTISVKTFSNNASLVVPSLAEKLTEKLKDKFMKELNLRLVEDNADISFSGAITDYKTAPSSIASDDRAATTRLTIAVKIKCDNSKEPKNSFESSFSNYADFNSNVDLSSVEDELIEQISEKLVQDIFNRAVNNW